jgi:hypothetical protein
VQTRWRNSASEAAGNEDDKTARKLNYSGKKKKKMKDWELHMRCGLDCASFWRGIDCINICFCWESPVILDE